MKYEITAQRIKQILDIRRMKAQELSNASGVAKASISHYLHGTHKPTNISAVKMANVLHVEPMWLMGFDVPMLPVDYEQPKESYYLNEETAKKAQEIYDDPNTRILLDARRDLAPEDLDIVVALVRKLKGD